MKTLSKAKSATSVVIWVAAVLVLWWAGAPAHAQTILYVDQNASVPIHDGWTRCTGFTDLQDALDLAVYNVVIRVANETSTPDRGTGDRTATFHCRRDLHSRARGRRPERAYCPTCYSGILATDACVGNQTARAHKSLDLSRRGRPYHPDQCSAFGCAR